jgi:hypothetical protein
LRFAVHWPASAVASPRFHGVPRRDVSGRVYIGVAGELAGHAPEEGLALAALRCDVPARTAPLRRVRGWYLLDSPRCFVFQPTDQDSPTRPLNAPVHVEPSRKAGAGLLPPVHAPVRLPGLHARDLGPGPGAAVIPDCLLLDDHGPGGEPRVICPRFGQLPTALGEAGHLPPSRTPSVFLLDAQVPNIAGRFTVPQQHRLLFGSWRETVSAHVNVIANSIDREDVVAKTRPCCARFRIPLRSEGRCLHRRSL